MIWYEVRLAKGKEPLRQFYARVDMDGVYSYHHFWDEPWWPGAYVVRIHAGEDYSLSVDHILDVDHIAVWDATEDERAYGDLWPAVERFFYAGSMISRVKREDDLTLKLVHCFLNSRGMSQWDETKFAARFLWNRLTVRLRWHLYLRRKWERQQRAKAQVTPCA